MVRGCALATEAFAEKACPDSLNYDHCGVEKHHVEDRAYIFDGVFGLYPSLLEVNVVGFVLRQHKYLLVD